MNRSRTNDGRDGRFVHAVSHGPWITRLDVLGPCVVRVRRFPKGASPPTSLLNRYGFLFEAPDAPVEAKVVEHDHCCEVRTASMAVSVDRDAGAISVRDGDGCERLRETQAPGLDANGARMAFRLEPDARLYGLGDQTRDRIEHRGTRGDLWVRNVRSYIPIPILFSTAGVGLLINTTRRVLFDLGATDPETMTFRAPRGEWDLYLLYGPSLEAQMQAYTRLTGRPPLPPKWAFGLWFICRTQADAREFMDDCRAFRTFDIPCDAISLEPGWMAVNYDFSTKKDWHPERFPIPSYAPCGRHNFLPAARRMGYKPGLWLCCDYDFTWEEERRVHKTIAGGSAGPEEGSAETPFETVEKDEHLEGVRRMDALTDPNEPWFEHLKKFIDQGVLWFKQDGANQVLAHLDRVYGNGMRDDVMHNLIPLLYSRQMTEGFAEYTGKRPFGFTVAGWAGLQHYTATWTGDTGGEEGPLVACLNCSLSGHGMTTCDMEVTTVEGIHFGFLLPWAQLNSWNYWRHPWYQGEFLERIFREYARLRYRLIPYLYSAAHEAETTGLPLLRAMPLAFPGDPHTSDLTRQYMLGPALLVGAFTRSVYLPAGQWVNFWTGDRLAGGGNVEPRVPEDRGGPLLLPAGAIVPLGPVVPYVGARSDDEYEVLVVPGADGRFMLYEDDGETFAYRDGAFRTTGLLLKSEADGTVALEIQAAQGGFPGAAAERAWSVRVCGVRKIEDVRVDGRPAEARPADLNAFLVSVGRSTPDTPHSVTFRWN